MGQSPAPFLLTMPQYAGTLAATRCLGEHGVPVTMVGTSIFAPARWSRYVCRWLKAPAVTDTQAFLDWLLAFGKREPGHVLYPTSDDLAWLFAQHAGELGKNFRLFQPRVDVVVSLLDKKALHAACVEAGIDTVPTCFPTGGAQLTSLMKDFAFPLLLKPRTQALLATLHKGRLVHHQNELEDVFREFVAENPYRPELTRALPGIHLPMLQVYRPQAVDGIYSLAGFISPGGQMALRASRKILQRPRRMGVGLCFEEARVDQDVSERLARLCRSLGYFGVFEAEFVRDGESLQMIDFNPRFYGQMAFETARALPLGYLSWLGALDRTEELEQELARARNWQEGRGYAYCDRLYLNTVLLLQGLARKMPASEVRHWRDWQRHHKKHALMVDAAHEVRDPWPGYALGMHELYAALRHPRAFLRKTVLNV